jgi:hypothetical protein
VWAGIEVFRAGERVVGVEYDSAETLAAVRSRCEEWRPAPGAAALEDVPAAFGVRVAKVGFRRRAVGVVHHGAPVRYRFDTPDGAIDAIALILADVATDRPANAVSIDARCFVRGGLAVLVDVPLSRDVDERPLRAAGIEEVPAWRPIVDVEAMTVRVRDEVWPFAGIAMVGTMMVDLAACRRHLFHHAEGDVLAWADLLDGLPDDRLVRADDVLEACERVMA